MKRLLSLLLILVLAFLLYACDSGTSRCTICQKTATHTFQGSGYCDKHYQDAIIWAFDHVS